MRIPREERAAKFCGTPRATSKRNEAEEKETERDRDALDSPASGSLVV